MSVRNPPHLFSHLPFVASLPGNRMTVQTAARSHLRGQRRAKGTMASVVCVSCSRRVQAGTEQPTRSYQGSNYSRVTHRFQPSHKSLAHISRVQLLSHAHTSHRTRPLALVMVMPIRNDAGSDVTHANSPDGLVTIELSPGQRVKELR